VSDTSVARPSSRIVEVTVYRDRAEVVREAVIEVPAGMSTVEITDLPLLVDRGSLRVSASGVPALLGALEVRDHMETPEGSPEEAASRAEVSRLETEIAKIAARDHVAADLREFLTSLRATTASRESASIGAGKADPAAIAGTYDLLAKKLEELAVQDLARKEATAHLVQSLEAARRKLAAAPSTAAIHSVAAGVEVEARRAGALTLRLAYFVSGAAWGPAYRATLDATSGQVALVSEGVVRQGTGEDWKDVSLRLSTASPARGVAPPEEASLLLRPLEAGSAAVRLGDEFLADLPIQGRYYQNMLTLAPGVQDSDADGKGVETTGFRIANVVQTAYNVTFEVAGRSSVPQDGSFHRVVLHEETLPGTESYRTAPGIEAAAFLTSVVRAPAQVPLLSGPMQVLAGGAYLGMVQIPETAPGGELTVPFGRDNRIKVDRVLTPREQSLEGIGGKTRKIAYERRTRIENLRDDEITVVVEDRIPVSEDERIVVDLGKETTQGHQPSKNRPGVLLWKSTLAPREKKEVSLSYVVRYPRDLVVPGVE
jgi:uncharacterized protein (TIGR02231 family)